ncbi:MAG TPA: hypothetical protein VEP90_07555 [Methylomirabilota bacterium]|nr:hypothetical protein [Methylomirabilota bacterium]
MDIITNIIALTAAIVGLIGSIYAYLTTRTPRKFLPADDSLIISKVLRTPLDENLWKELKSARTPLTNFAKIIIFIIFSGLFSPIIKLLTNNFNDFLSRLISFISPLNSIPGIIIGLIIIFTSSFIGVNIYLRRQKFGKTPEEARFFIFKDAIITVVAEYNDIINRCYEVLKIMNTNSVELNTDAQYLEAQKTFRLNTAIGIVKIEVKPIYSSQPVIINPIHRREYSIKVSFQTRYSESIELRSRITNNFIDQFIGQTKP